MKNTTYRDEAGTLYVKAKVIYALLAVFVLWGTKDSFVEIYQVATSTNESLNAKHHRPAED